MRAMDVGHALDDLPDSELQKMVNDWRAASPNVVKLWYDCDRAARRAMTTGQAVTVGTGCPITYRYESGNGLNFLTVELPSGRKLFYAEPHFGLNRFGQESVYYYGQNQTTKAWQEVDIFSGKWVENCVQAIARDLLCESIEKLEKAGFPVEFSVHDEVVIDYELKPGDDPDKLLKQVTDIMSQNPSWAMGLPLNAEGWHGSYFRKD